MKAASRRTRIALALAAAATVLLALAACTGSGGQEPSPGDEGLSLVQSDAPPGKVQLLVTKVDESTVAMRSPTFRCAADYCAGAVIRGLEEILGKDSFDWSTGVVPNEEFVELRIRFDPSRFAVEDIVRATRQAMEKYRDPGFPAAVEVVYVPEFTDFLPIVLSSERVVGDNRFVLALLDTNNELILDARVRLRFFKAENPQPTLKIETEAAPITIDKFFVETHADGTVHRHEAGQTGAYVARLRFDSAGPWQVEVEPILYGSPLRPVRTGFEVSQEGIGLEVGDPAPRSQQPTTGDVDDVSEIDSSFPPRTEMHTMTIAEAVDSGRPTVVAFATPAFCVSRVCGPVTEEVMDPLFEKYQGRVNFIHVEPYKLKEARAGIGLFLSDTMQEWGLRTEPWIFAAMGVSRRSSKGSPLRTRWRRYCATCSHASPGLPAYPRPWHGSPFYEM